MKAKQAIGLIVGIGAFILALLIPLEGLSLSGQITLGIFAMAAFFWILEPIPIYATSMLIILLQVILLSSQGFVFSPKYAPQVGVVEEVAEGAPAYRVPLEALSDSGQIFKVTAKAAKPLSEFEIVSKDAESVLIRSKSLSASDRVIEDGDHRSVATETSSYATFYSTLASPIIILFLGGFALAASAVKFGLDKNMTRVLLKPFGNKPQYVCLGLMICTAILSAFMSNTATTAMMMTVVLPIVGGMAMSDPFRKGVALAIPVAANVGGIATPIGTPPNAVALAALKESGINISFSSWMLMAVPFTIILLFISWRLIMWFFKPNIDRFEVNLDSEFNKSPKAILSYIVFGATILLWVTEKLHGISTSMVAFIPVAVLPALGVLEKKDIRGFSWEVLWLVGGGISMGLSMKDTGLAYWLIELVSWDSFSGLAVIIVFSLVGFAIANLISHTVASTMLMPLAITVGTGLAAVGGFNLPAAIVAITVMVSLAMILPISTPPNAIAMSTGVIETKDLAKVGIAVGVAGFIIAIVCAAYVWPHMIG